MEYFILIFLFSTSFSKSVSKTRMNLLDNLRAPLFAELDVSNVQNYIDTKIDTRLDHINDTLDDKIEAIIDNKMNEDNLDKTKPENDERVSGIISNFKSLEEIVKNLRNENKQLKEDFTEWQTNYTKTDTCLDHINDNLDKTKLENDERVSGFISDLKSVEEIVKNLKNENNQPKEDFKKWKKIDKNHISARDCSDFKPRSGNGVYTIYPISEANDGFKVYCDMETDGGGWTVFQRRINGETDFFRSWLEYQKGFGDLGKEFWLGNDKLHSITSLYQYELRIGLKDFEGQTGYAKYTRFSIGDASRLYKLSVGTYSGTIGDSLRENNGQSFTTTDRDNDQLSFKCADIRHGAWWFSDCGSSSLNGKYLRKSAADSNYVGITWVRWKGNWNSLKKTYMMIRRL